MNEYDRSVSEVEFESSPLPSLPSIVAMAQGLGIQLSVDVPILECVFSVVHATPNARLRWILDQVYRFIRDDSAMAEAISIHPDVLDESFIAAVVEGEKTNNLGNCLLQYARAHHRTPNQLLADAVGRPRDVRLFTTQMSQHLRSGLSVTHALRCCLNELDDSLHAMIVRVANKYKKCEYLFQALSFEPEIFDRIYFNVIKAGEMDGNILHSFMLLASP